MKTLALSKAEANRPDEAIDKLYDDLHFLSSREYSIDVWNGGLFTNTGNILYSAADKEFRIIDLQPFVRQHIGIPANHTKGFNIPYCLAHGLLPGMYKYADEHAKYPPLIDYRTEIISKIVKGAKRNNLNDVGGYFKGTIDDMANYWKIMLDKIHIPEKDAKSFINDICSVKQEHRYRLTKSNIPLIRVSGRSMYS